MSLPPSLITDQSALFLDFDGTLVAIAERPDAVHVEPETLATLRRLQSALGGALAILTGREIAAVDAFLAPLRLPVAGVHGLMRRDAEGRLGPLPETADFIDNAVRRLAPLIAAEDGLILERKPVSLALHYRARPDLEGVCLTTLQDIANPYPDIELKRGKMVIEAKPAGADKGTALADFMGEAPFKGRKPVFAGDDVTDEDAFEVVNDLGGISIKVGEGETAARHRVADTTTFLDWLSAASRRLREAEA